MQNLINELKRRNVFKVAMAYLVVAWLLLQVASEITEPLHLPEWFPTLVITLLGIGFPIAILLAWAFELTPEGIKKASEVDGQPSISRDSNRKRGGFIIVVLLLTAGFTAWNAGLFTGTENASINPDASIAVLPFSNLSGNSDTDYFVAGLHDDLLTQLSKVAALKVISRTSVLQYANSSKSMKQIGQELGVSTLMEGGVQRAGDQLRINVQLIDAESDEHLWAETYDRKLSTNNIFQLQKEITLKVAEALKARLSLDEKTSISQQTTDNLEAYDAFARARLLLDHQRNESRHKEGMVFARKAVELDPRFIEAWALMGWSHIQEYWWRDRSEYHQREAERYINRAESIDASHPMALAMRGFYTYHTYLDYESAIGFFRQALNAQPGLVIAKSGMAYALRRSGKWEEAVQNLKKVVELEPTNYTHWFALINTEIFMGRLGEARADLSRFARQDSEDYMYLRALTDIHKHQGDDPSLRLTTLQAGLEQYENPRISLKVEYLLNEAKFGSPEKAEKYLQNHIASDVDSGTVFYTRKLAQAYIEHYKGNKAASKALAANEIDVIKTRLLEHEKKESLLSALGLAQALAGKADEVIKTSERLLEVYNCKRDAFGCILYRENAIAMNAMAGNTDAALQILQDSLAMEAHYTVASFSKDPDYANIQQTKRFLELLAAERASGRLD